MRSPHCRKRPGSPRPCASRRSRSSRRCPSRRRRRRSGGTRICRTSTLDFAPYTPGGRAQNLDDVPAEILAAAGAVGERAGLLIQHDSDVMLSHLDPALAAKGVLFTDLDAAAAEHPDLIGNALHSLVPTDRSKFLAMHGAFRTGGTFLYVPRDTVVELPLQTLTWLDADGIAVFPHTLIVVEAGAEVTFIERYASPDLTRAFSNAVTEIVVGDGAHVRYAAIQDWGAGVTHLAVQRARVGRDAEVRTLSAGVRRRPRPHRDRGRAGRARRVQRAARGVLRRRRAALRPPFGPGARGTELHERSAVQGRAARSLARRVLRVGVRAPRRAEDRRDADQPQHRAQRARQSRRHPQPGDRGQRREVRPRRQRGPGGRRGDLLPAVPGDPARRGRAPHRQRVLPGGPGPGADHEVREGAEAAIDAELDRGVR